jgi:DNA-directed RNA polymerase specialized sigma24 family protein
VEASLDPRAFDPPCESYVSRRERVATAAGDRDPLDLLPDPTPNAEAVLAARERAELLAECLGAVQRANPTAHVVLLKAYFKNETNEAIARTLKATVRTVSRYKERGLELLREEMRRRGISGVVDFE